jgi:SNF2 family DNA or RNA helicase
MVTITIRKSKFIPDDYSAYVSFPYSEDKVEKIRSLKKRSWIKGSKEWEIQISDIELLFDMFSNESFEIKGRYVDMSPKEFISSDAYNFKTGCFEHQIEGFEFGMNHERWLLGDEMGLGKTKQVIDIAVARKQMFGYSHCLIICGVNSLKWNWRNEIVKHSDESGYILGQRTKKRTGELYIGSTKDKLDDIQNLDKISDYFIITNVESLRDDDIATEIKNWLHSDTECKINMIAADEIHKCKNPNSQQGNAFIKLDADIRIAMTGTPLMNNPMDLYIILRWLGYEKHSYYSFKQYYCVMGGYGGYEVIGYKHLDELEGELRSIMLRRLKDDVLDLPEKTYIDEYVDMLPKQATIYKEVKADIKSNIDMISIAPNPLAEMIRLRQATGYTGILSSEIQCSAKLDRMEELVEDAVKNKKKVIVFSNWTQITDVAYKKLLDKGFVGKMITGDTKDESRQLIVDAFQTSEYEDFIIGTTGAMGTGITLTAATVVIFVDHPWSRALYEQAVDRAHRVGQKNNITIYNIMCKNTIDERIWGLVNSKGEMSDMIIDGKVPSANRRELIDYLLS